MDSSELEENIHRTFRKLRKVYHNPELAMELAIKECGVSERKLILILGGEIE